MNSSRSATSLPAAKSPMPMVSASSPVRSSKCLSSEMMISARAMKERLEVTRYTSSLGPLPRGDQSVSSCVPGRSLPA